MPIGPHTEQVIAECQKIEALARELAGAASRHFCAPIEDHDFEAEDGGEFAKSLTRVRRLLEKAIRAAEGMDPALDTAAYLYK